MTFSTKINDYDDVDDDIPVSADGGNGYNGCGAVTDDVEADGKDDDGYDENAAACDCGDDDDNGDGV